MAKRALIGLVKGLLIGGVAALILIKGLGVVVFGALMAYPIAVLIGILTGLVAGKPIWAQDGRIEGALKAVAGAIVAGGLMFAIRTWLNPAVDLGSFGAAGIGQLPAVSLPMIATALAVLFELDNTGPPPEQVSPKQRVGPEPAARQVDDLESELDADESSRSADRAGRKG
jgi:hypothetical protein